MGVGAGAGGGAGVGLGTASGGADGGGAGEVSGSGTSPPLALSWRKTRASSRVGKSIGLPHLGQPNRARTGGIRSRLIEKLLAQVGQENVYRDASVMDSIAGNAILARVIRVIAAAHRERRIERVAKDLDARALRRLHDRDDVEAA